MTEIGKENRRNSTESERIKVLREKHVPLLLCTLQIP